MRRYHSVFTHLKQVVELCWSNIFPYANRCLWFLLGDESFILSGWNKVKSGDFSLSPNRFACSSSTETPGIRSDTKTWNSGAPLKKADIRARSAFAVCNLKKTIHVALRGEYVEIWNNSLRRCQFVWQCRHNGSGSPESGSKAFCSWLIHTITFT